MAFLLLLHFLCFDNEMIVRILQEVIISMGTEPILAQRPCFARAKASEVTAKLPILENLRQTPRPPGNLLFAGWLILFLFVFILLISESKERGGREEERER